jgi:hypothetical protein
VNSRNLAVGILQDNSLIRTDRNTGSASSAPIRKEHHLGRCLLALWIVTPHALKRTAFKEHRGSDAGPVMNGVFLYVKYGSNHPVTAPYHGMRPTPFLRVNSMVVALFY